ncbi:MAG: DNA helicase [Parvibaculum sp.]
MKLSFPIFRLKRQARLLSRETKIPLHRALDDVARAEGFQSWSHLAASASNERPTGDLLAHFVPGDLVLLGARPGHGKTLLGLDLVAQAAAEGRPAFFFTLEHTEEDVLSRLRSLGKDPEKLMPFFTLDTSNDICAAYVIERLTDVPDKAIAVIDYLQLLDQNRQHPEVSAQIGALESHARATGTTIVLISQIDRAFERQGGRLPDMSDVRLPNPVDLSLFTKTCFLHEGEIRLESVA